MNWKIKKNVELLILFLVLNQLVIDTFNGYFIFSSQGGGNISVIYKIIIFFLFLFYELVSRDRFIVAFSIVTWGVFLTFFHLLSNNYTEVVMDLSEYIKLATTFIVFLGVSKFSYINPLAFIKYLSVYSFCIILFNFLLSAFGVGETSYSDFGYKGFFYAANALSGVFCIVACFLMYITLKKSLTYYIICAGVLALCSFAIGTKTGIVFVAISLVTIPLLMEGKKAKIRVSLLSLVGFLCALVIYADKIYTSNLVLRIVHFYEVGGWSKMLFSDRDLFLKYNIDQFLNSDPVSLLIGIGYAGINAFPKPLTEIDIADITIIYGMLTTSAYISFYIGILFYSNGYLKKNCPRDIIAISRYICLVLMIVSSIAGHILFNGMVTLYLGVAMALPWWMANYRTRHIKGLKINV